MSKKAYCEVCDNKEKYFVLNRTRKVIVEDVPITFLEKTAYCKSCGEEVYVPEVHYENCATKEEAFLAERERIECIQSH